MSGPLAGLKVLELGTLIAGPFPARVFAEFGAEVIKVEDPSTGDPIRNWRHLHEGTSLWWYVQARNKKSIALNLKDARGRRSRRRWRWTPMWSSKITGPVYWKSGGLGTSSFVPAIRRRSWCGSRATGRPGQCATGRDSGRSENRWAESATYPVIRIDLRCASASRSAIRSRRCTESSVPLMALHHRDATGGRGRGAGQLVDVALYEAVFNMMESTVPEFDRFGVVRERTGGALPGIVPSNTYTCGVRSQSQSEAMSLEIPGMPFT